MPEFDKFFCDSSNNIPQNIIEMYSEHVGIICGQYRQAYFNT